jgi:hypothetical protein
LTFMLSKCKRGSPCRGLLLLAGPHSRHHGRCYTAGLMKDV